MKTERLFREVLLPGAPEEIFAFFSDATNLETLTPPWLHFRVLTPAPIEMGVGTRIDYRLRVRGIPLRWTSRITAWEPPHRFVDEQERGPYRRWVHEHRFEACGEGTRAVDEVEYRAPGGALVHRLLVKPDVERIFDYRTRELQRLFPEPLAR